MKIINLFRLFLICSDFKINFLLTQKFNEEKREIEI